jgi:hypothetical protein
MNAIKQVVDPFILMAHTAANPTREEWSQFTGALTENIKGFLIYTRGGSPSALQRKQMRLIMDVLKISETPSAVLTEANSARDAVTALNLFFGGTVKTFPPEALEEALLYIKAPPQQWPQLKQTLYNLTQKLDL